MVMNETKEEPKEGSFWEGLSKLQKLIGFLTALIALVGGLYGGYKFFFPGPPQPAPGSANYTEIRIAKLRKCANLKVNAFEQMPYYLTPTLYKKTRKWLYWAVLSGTNNCDEEPLLVKVKFFISQQSSHLAYLDQGTKEIARDKLSEGPGEINEGLRKTLERNAKDTLTFWRGTVAPMQNVNEPLVPRIKFTKEDPDEPLTVEWEIQTLKDNLTIQCGTEHINMISKKYIYWDLKDTTGANVPSEFLLASLSAWTRIKDPKLERQAQQYLSAAAPRQSRPWFKGCYNALLGPEGLLTVHPYISPWPLTGTGDESRQPVRSPVEFITGNATAPAPLEAVLLVAALANNLPRKPDLALFALPLQTDSAAKRFLLAWSDNGIDWRALDLTSPQNLSFEDNEARTTAELANLLKSKPDILRKLDGTGVFIVGEQLSEVSRQVVALNFAKAAEIHQIQGLP